MATRANGSKALSWQSRPCPDDFEIVFVEKGRLECEAHYHARRTTITRWLEENGKKRLLKKRAEFVKFQRAMKKGPPKPDCPAKLNDTRKADPKLVAIAARFLQSPKAGGWVVYPLDEPGEWMVGTCRRSPAEVIDIAIRKGFDKHRALEQIKAFGEPI